jgi:hypothetical protein
MDALRRPAVQVWVALSVTQRVSCSLINCLSTPSGSPALPLHSCVRMHKLMAVALGW